MNWKFVHSVLIVISILLIVTQICYAKTTKSKYLYDPLFLVQYDPAKIIFKKVPDKIYECEGLSKLENILFVFGYIAHGDYEYYISSGWSKNNDASTNVKKYFVPRSDEGLIIAIKGKECQSASIGYLYSHNEITDKMEITDQIAMKLIGNVIDTESKAFGGLDRLYKKIDSKINKPDQLPYSLIQKRYLMYKHGN